MQVSSGNGDSDVWFDHRHLGQVLRVRYPIYPTAIARRSSYDMIAEAHLK
jgi:hypothetical protein